MMLVYIIRVILILRELDYPPLSFFLDTLQFDGGARYETAKFLTYFLASTNVQYMFSVYESTIQRLPIPCKT